MSDCLLYSLKFSGSLFAAILAAGQLLIIGKKKINYLYAFTFISISLWSGSDGLYYFFPILKDSFLYNMVDIISKTSYSLTAVLLYFMMQSIFQPSYLLGGKQLFLFFPGLLTFIILTTADIFFNSSYYILKTIISYALYIYSLAIYIFIVSRINMLRNFSVNKKSKRTILKIMFFLSLGAILTIIPELTPFSIKESPSILILIILFYLMTMRYPEIFILLREEATKAQYIKSKINNLDIKKIKKDLEHKLISEKLFADSDLTLKDLSTQIGITPHQLSEVLNVYYKKNFFDFINYYRVEEAKRIFSTDSTATALGICYQVGFNSNSAFYRAFKKETTISPGNYRKK